MSAFLPAMTCRLNGYHGLGSAHPGQQFITNIPCACWLSRGRTYGFGRPNDPRVVAQLATADTPPYDPPGWVGWPEVWDPGLADVFTVTPPVGTALSFSPLSVGFMWQGTPQAHDRWNLTPWKNIVLPPPKAFPTGRADGFTTTFDVYRPFGAALPVSTGNVGVFYSDNVTGRGSYSGGNYYTWSHFVDLASGVDVRDGQSRASGLDTLSYADGDEVRVPSGATVTRYVVVWVTKVLDLNGTIFKRAYLLRDQAHWPGP